MPAAASPTEVPSSMESLALCNCATCRSAAPRIVPGAVPAVRALPNWISSSAVRPANAASTKPSIARLDDDPAVRRRICNESVERRSKVARTGFHPDRAPAAEQWNGVGLLDEACGLARELIAVEPGELKWILGVVNRHAHERFRTLAH